MATITCTIGTRSDESISITGTSGSNPYTVSLSSATTTTSNGDSLVDDSSNVFLVTDGAGTDSLTVLDSTGVGSAPSSGGSEVTKRYYSTIATWESSLDDTDLYGSGDVSIGHMMADSDFTANSDEIENGKTVGLGGIHLTAPPDQRHDGTANTGVRIISTSAKAAVDWKGKYSFGGDTPGGRVSWIEADANGYNHYGYVQCTGNHSDPAVFDHLLIHSGGGSVRGLLRSSAAHAIVCHNCIVYDHPLNNNKTVGGIDLHGYTSRDYEVYNCTIYNITQAGSGTAHSISNIKDDSQHIVKNTIGVTATHDCFDDYLASPSNAVLSNNIASDPSCDGHTDSHENVAAADLFMSITPGDEDFQLKAGAVAIDAGLDLSLEVYPQIAISIFDGADETERSGDWDIGAHQRVAEVTTALPAAMNTYQQMVR